MKKSFLAGTLVAASVLMAACSTTTEKSAAPFTNIVEAPVSQTPNEFIEGQYIVVFADDELATQSAEDFALSVASFAEGAGVEVSKELKLINGFVATGLSPLSVQSLEADSRIKYIEQDGYVYAADVQNNATWGLDRIDQEDLPLNNRYNYTNTGRGVNVYIIDSGINPDHVEFTGRLGEWFSTYNDQYGRLSAVDCNEGGHGTHVAATAAGTTYGVAKEATIHVGRILGCDGRGALSNTVATMEWVINTHRRIGGPAVANMSLSGPKRQFTTDAVEAAISAGVTVVAAAGNENQNACNPSPAFIPSVITVGATNRNDQKASFSNYGRCVDILAPGRDITSAWVGSRNATATISGTSMASPHVAGVAALYLQNNRNASPAEVTRALINSAESNTITGFDANTANKLVQSDLGAGGVDPDPVADGVTFDGRLSYTGQYFNHNPYQASTGRQTIRLEGPSYADFDIYLFKKSSYSDNWYEVAKSENAGSDEEISYYGLAGEYAIQVKSYQGSGNYTAYIDLP